MYVIKIAWVSNLKLKPRLHWKKIFGLELLKSCVYLGRGGALSGTQQIIKKEYLRESFRNSDEEESTTLWKTVWANISKIW